MVKEEVTSRGEDTKSGLGLLYKFVRIPLKFLLTFHATEMVYLSVITHLKPRRFSVQNHAANGISGHCRVPHLCARVAALFGFRVCALQRKGVIFCPSL